LIEVYISNRRFWALQQGEGLFYIGLSVLLAGLSFIAIRRAKA